MSAPSLRRVMKYAAPLALLVVSSCTVVVDEPPIYPGPPGPAMCTREYAPVCGRRGNDRETFSNACRAESSGYRVIHSGECRRGGPGPGPGFPGPGPGFPGPGPGPGGPAFCTREYAPVCARSGPQVRTFGNACEARAANFRILYDSPCR